MLSRNQFAGNCNSPVCKTRVAPGAGYRQQINGRWVVWCSQCVPQRITPAKEVQRELSVHGEIRMPYEPENLPLIRAMPGARWNPDGKFWTVSTDDADRKRVLELADRIGLKVAEEFRAISLAEPAQNAIYAGLYGFQIEGVNWLSKQTSALLGDDMGLGKSVQALMSLPSDGYGLIVAPAGLKYNWQDECKKWRDDLTCTVLNGENSFRWPNKGEVVIMSYNSLPNWLITPKKTAGQTDKVYYASLKDWRTDLQTKHPISLETTLIVDEAHNVKNYKTQKSQKVKNLSSITKRTWGLTGTPLVNRPTDLYGILDSLNMAYKAFGGLSRFRTLFNASRSRFGWEYGLPMPIVPELLRRVMLRRLRSEVLPDLPNKTYTNLMVDVENSLIEKLDEMWSEFGDEIEIAEELPPFEKFAKIRYELAKSRIPAMLEYVENAEEQDVPLVVFSAHLAPLDALLVREGWAVISGDTPPQRRQEIVRDFQAGKLKGVGVSIKAGGVGLTLTRAWKALFVDLDWTPAANTQAEDRICRIGQQSNKVEIVRMTSNHPLDIHVMKLIEAKMALIQATIENSVVGQIKEYRAAPEGETEEQFEARMLKIMQLTQEELDRQQALQSQNKKLVGKSKVSIIHSREKGKADSSDRKILPLTEERVAAVKDSFGYMMSVCDGAHSKDNQGFNKPDASVARYLVWAGLENDAELEAAYYMLTRYHRQLSTKWPILFKEKK